MNPRRPLSTCVGWVGSVEVVPDVPTGVVLGGLLLIVSLHPTHVMKAIAANVLISFIYTPPHSGLSKVRAVV
jgi:hypothetical protein